MQSMIKAKRNRASGSVTSVRVVGILVHSTEDDTVPMYIVPGHAPAQGAEGVEAMTFCRRDTKWNHVDSMFSTSMHVEGKKLGEVVQEMKGYLGEEESKKRAEKYSFSMIWRNESHPGLERILEKDPCRGCVLGTLEVTVPYVVVREPQYCEEIMSLVGELKVE